MKKIFALILMLIFFASIFCLSIQPARAESPEPHQYGMVNCSGLPVEKIVLGQNKFNYQYGLLHKLTTDDQWRLSYFARTNEYASSVNCPQVFDDNGNLTLFYKLFDSVFRAIIENANPNPIQ